MQPGNPYYHDRPEIIFQCSGMISGGSSIISGGHEFISEPSDSISGHPVIISQPPEIIHERSEIIHEGPGMTSGSPSPIPELLKIIHGHPVTGYDPLKNLLLTPKTPSHG